MLLKKESVNGKQGYYGKYCQPGAPPEQGIRANL
jgi:hypothetical protein